MKTDRVNNTNTALKQVLLHMRTTLLGILSDGKGRGEYELIKSLQQDEQLRPLLTTAAGDSLALYRTHFMLFHVLYHLADELAQSQQALLEISALSIRCGEYRAGEQRLAQTDAVREYYLDWQNYDQADAKVVDELIASFWIGLHRQYDRKDALNTLGLSDPVDDGIIRKAYQRLAMEYHPDRGGDDEKIQMINAAARLLLK